MKNFLIFLISLIHLNVLTSSSDDQCTFPSEAYDQRAAQQRFYWSHNETYRVIEIDNSKGAQRLDGGFCGYDGLSIGASCYRGCQMASRLCSSDNWGENNTDYIQTNPMGLFFQYARS